jgi:hypothetical protein
LSNYNSQRQAIIEGALREAFAEKFQVEFSEEGDWSLIEIESLPKGCLGALGKFLGRIIGEKTISELLERDEVRFKKLAESWRIQRLKDLARKNPFDYAEFRVDFFIANGRQPEEDGSKKVAQKKKP